MRRLQDLCFEAAANSFGVPIAMVKAKTNDHHPARHYARTAYRIVSERSFDRAAADLGLARRTLVYSADVATMDRSRLAAIVSAVRLALDAQTAVA